MKEETIKRLSEQSANYHKVFMEHQKLKSDYDKLRDAFEEAVEWIVSDYSTKTKTEEFIRSEWHKKAGLPLPQKP